MKMMVLVVSGKVQTVTRVPSPFADLFGNDFKAKDLSLRSLRAASL